MNRFLYTGILLIMLVCGKNVDIYTRWSAGLISWLDKCGELPVGPVGGCVLADLAFISFTLIKKQCIKDRVLVVQMRYVGLL